MSDGLIITLSGPPGSGKTRWAEEIRHRVLITRSRPDPLPEPTIIDESEDRLPEPPPAGPVFDRVVDAAAKQAIAEIRAERGDRLRDEFAMAALTGMLKPGDATAAGFDTRIAVAAYRYADAMLEARGK